MKTVHRVSKLAVPFFLLTLLLIATVPGEVKTQNSQKQGTLLHTSRSNPTETQIFSVDSRLDLELPDLAPDADWIVGVQTTKGNEKETVTANLVSWGDSHKYPAFAGKPLKTKLVSELTDYPAEMIRKSRGIVKLPGLAHFDVNSGSLIVHLKVSPETQVHVWRGGKEFISPSPNSTFVLHNGVLTQRPIKGIHSLLGRLIRSKMLNSQSQSGTTIKLLKPMVPNSLSGFTPVKAAFSSKPRSFPPITCTTEWADEETETCFSVSVSVRCSEGAQTIECSATVSACDDGAGGVIIAVTGGCS